MKKLVLAGLILFSIHVFSQSTYTEEAGKWRIGLNAGAMWQTCDVTPYANIAGGFTIEKILNKKSDAMIGFALGLRYLSGHCTGLDTKPSYGVANNTALNGTSDSTVNYAKHGGVFYNNYKTYIHEGALELKINFPRFEQKTNLIFHIIGGIGICNYKTWINALDVNGNMYDFTTLQNAQNVTAADVKKVLNGSYGTLAQGSSSSGTTRFTPSVGVGFGFKLNKYISLVFEYRAAFQRTNLLDGVNYDNNNAPIKQNDFYNYASANLLFTIYGRSGKSAYTNHAQQTTGYTNASPQTQTVYNNVPPPVQQQPVYTNQQPVVYNSPPPVPQGYPPYVTISYPQNNFSNQGNYVTVQANVQNIQNAQQVSISQNGYPVKYFTYDSYSGNLSFQTFLQTGANNIIIAANNPFGAGSQGVTVFYNPPYVPDNNNPAIINSDPGNPPSNYQPVPHTQLTVKKPIVQYINPAVSPEEVSTPVFNVSASVQNIGGSNQLTITFNGTGVSQFNYNPSTKSVDFNVTLLTGYNSVNISASNVAGTDAKSTVIDYKPVGRPPRIDIFNPSTNPFTSASTNMIVSGYVYNVSSASDISVNYDGNPVTFNYNNTTHEIEVPVTLYSNSNQLQIKAVNTFGNDVKQITLLLPAVVNSPVTTSTSYTLQTQTPQSISTFTLMSHTAGVNNGQSTPNTNAGAGGHHNKPEFTLISPNVNPYTSMSGVISVSANLDYVQNANEVSVTYNGAPVSFSYNPVAGEHLGFTSPLKPGSNIFIINASNMFGSISESIEVNYTPTNPNGNVNGNPALHFSGGSNITANTPKVFTVTPVNAAPARPVSTPVNTSHTPQQQSTPGKPLIRPR